MWWKQVIISKKLVGYCVSPFNSMCMITSHWQTLEFVKWRGQQHIWDHNDVALFTEERRHWTCTLGLRGKGTNYFDLSSLWKICSKFEKFEIKCWTIRATPLRNSSLCRLYLWYMGKRAWEGERQVFYVSLKLNSCTNHSCSLGCYIL